MSCTMFQKSLLSLSRQQRSTAKATSNFLSTPKIFRQQQQIQKQIPTNYSNNFHTTTYNQQQQKPDRHGTTIVCVRKNGHVCMMGDGMVSQGSMIVKPNALKIRRIVSKTGSSTPSSSDKDNENDDKASKDKFVTIVGFAGSTADAFTLLERLEGKLDEYPGQLARSCVELAKGWRTDKYLRRLEASLIVADSTCSLELTGNGDVLESHDGVLGVGSGSPYAIAAARALMDIPELSAEDVAKKAMRVASDMCVYTNDNFRTEIIQTTEVVKKKTLLLIKRKID